MSDPILETPNGRWRWLGTTEPGPADPVRDRFEALMAAARYARSAAYAPYSGLRVGAAVLMDGDISTGANVENASYGATICAERSAIFSSVVGGRRDLRAVAVSIDNPAGEPLENRSPCGMCRQVIGEFSAEDALVLLDAGRSDRVDYSGEIVPFDRLFPWRFKLGE